MLKIENISVSYRVKGSSLEVLQNFSLQLEQGEILAVLGPSGCGKTTLIQVLAGMLPVDRGTVTMLEGGKALPLNPKNHTISVIPQNCGLLPWKTVRQNCLLPLKLHHRRINEKNRAELDEICRSLQVDSLLERYPRELSGGQVQRAALARAFLQEPDLLLMDEPFSALDAMTRSEAWALFLRIWTQKQPTTLLVTHSMEEALYLGKRIAMFDKEKGRFLTCMENPYFHQPEPSGEDFLRMKKNLQEHLKISGGREEP